MSPRGSLSSAGCSCQSYLSTTDLDNRFALVFSTPSIWDATRKRWHCRHHPHRVVSKDQSLGTLFPHVTIDVQLHYLGEAGPLCLSCLWQKPGLHVKQQETPSSLCGGASLKGPLPAPLCRRPPNPSVMHWTLFEGMVILWLVVDHSLWIRSLDLSNTPSPLWPPPPLRVFDASDSEGLSNEEELRELLGELRWPPL